MIPITITVSGPGTTFDPEFQAIEKLFRDQGYQIRVENEYPSEIRSRSPDIQKLMDIKLVAEHCPWGG